MTDITAPYCMANDNIVMLLLILNLVGISYVLLMNGANIIERAKCIFYYENKSTPYNDRTHIDKVCNLIMYFQTIFHTAIIAAGVLQGGGKGIVNGSVPITMLAIAVTTTLFLAFKHLLYSLVNLTLFSKKTSAEWNSFYFFTVKLVGFALAPAAIAILFIPSIPLNFVSIYSILVLILHLCTVTSGVLKIIFTKKVIYMELFLYLCALEFLPTAVVWKSILQLDDFITIKI